MNTSRPPFCLIPGQDPAEAAVDMVAAFAELSRHPDKTSQAFDAAIHELGADEQAPLVRAGRELAKTIDRENTSGSESPYHNPLHFCETLLSTHFICRLAGFAAGAHLELLFAALAHDFHHDGTRNGQLPFRLERQSIDALQPYLDAAGVDAGQRRRIAALILATDVLHGLDTAHACHDHHFRAATRPPIPPTALEMLELAENPLASRQALALCEADVLPSVGLTIDYALTLHNRLADEWQTPLGKEDKLRFITMVFSGFVIATYFQPNVDRLRHYLLDNLSHGTA
jgi:hypothetical protein